MNEASTEGVTETPISLLTRSELFARLQVQLPIAGVGLDADAMANHVAATVDYLVGEADEGDETQASDLAPTQLYRMARALRGMVDVKHRPGNYRGRPPGPSLKERADRIRQMHAVAAALGSRIGVAMPPLAELMSRQDAALFNEATRAPTGSDARSSDSAYAKGAATSALAVNIEYEIDHRSRKGKRKSTLKRSR